MGVDFYGRRLAAAEQVLVANQPDNDEEDSHADAEGCPLGYVALQAFTKVIVPISAPGVFTTAILTFISAWNEFLFANTFAFDASTQPVTVVIPSFADIFTINYVRRPRRRSW